MGYVKRKAWFLGMFVITVAASQWGVASESISLTVVDDPDDPQARVFDVTQSSSGAVQLVCDEQGGDAERHLVRGSGTDAEQTLRLRGLKADSTYRCFALGGRRSVSNSVEFTTAPLPDDLLVPTLIMPSAHPSQTGYMLFAVGNMYYNGHIIDGFDPQKLSSDSNYLVIVDTLGNVRWYFAGPGAGDFQTHYLGDDRILFAGQGFPKAWGPTIVRLDKSLEVTATQEKTVSYEVSNEEGLYYNHDVFLAADGESVFTFVHTRQGSLVGFIIKEFSLSDEDGNGVLDDVLWYWDSFEEEARGNIEQYNPLEPYTEDPLHPNSIWVTRGQDGKRALYVSLRNSSEIIKIDYSTKDVLWTMGYNSGDFVLFDANWTLADPSRWFFNQHHVQLSNGRLVLYDNGSDRFLAGGDPYTRGLVLEFDENSRYVRIVQEYTESDWLEPFWGGYTLNADGTQLVASGHCEFCEASSPFGSFITLADSQGAPLWRVQYDDDHLEAMLYRVENISGCDIFNNLLFCPNGSF